MAGLGGPAVGAWPKGAPPHSATVKTKTFCASQTVNLLLQGVTLKLQLAAAMPPPARKRIIFKDNNHVVLEVLFGPTYLN